MVESLTYSNAFSLCRNVRDQKEKIWVFHVIVDSFLGSHSFSD